MRHAINEIASSHLTITPVFLTVLLIFKFHCIEELRARVHQNCGAPITFLLLMLIAVNTSRIGAVIMVHMYLSYEKP